MKVLIVDDTVLLLMEFQHFVTELGYKVTTATSGDQALQKLLEHRDRGDPFSAVITDMQMPRGSGLELLQGMERLKGRPPCLVHSSSESFVHEGRLLMLSELDTIFANTRFHLKPISITEADLAYIKHFLSEVAQ